MPDRRTFDNHQLPEETAEFYCRTMRVLQEHDVPFLVGGAYAFGRYTGIERHTKDFDVFIHHRDVDRALDVIAGEGYEIDHAFPHWLAKARHGEESIDLIYASGNGLARVDEVWFERGVEDEVLGMPVLLCPPEEIIWTKAFIMERERYDGADVSHLLLRYHEHVDWHRLVDLFGPYWQVLLAHLILFQFIYPSDRDAVPDAVVEKLLGRMRTYHRMSPPAGRLCQGTLLSRAQYLIDIQAWDYTDARLKPLGEMTLDQVKHWTDAIDQDD